MQWFEWAPVAALATTTLVFLSLWLRCSRTQTKDPYWRSIQSTDSPVYGLVEDIQYQLLTKVELEISDEAHTAGVAATDRSTNHAFLINAQLPHLKIGDLFTLKNGRLHRIETRATAANNNSGSTADVLPPLNVGPDAVKTSTNPGGSDLTVMYTTDHKSSQQHNDPLDGFPYLEVIEGPDLGTRYPLAFGISSIGRSENCEVMLSDDGTSRQHCEIRFDSPHFILADLASTNGTLCNNQLIDQQKLEFNDLIQVSDTIMKFTCLGIELASTSPAEAITAYEQCVDNEPDFLLALKNLAFLLERDVGRKKEADPLWKRIALLEKRQ